MSSDTNEIKIYIAERAEGQVPCPHCAGMEQDLGKLARKISRRKGSPGGVTIECQHGRILAFPHGWPSGWVQFRCGDAVRGGVINEAIPCNGHYHKFDASGRDLRQ